MTAFKLFLLLALLVSMISAENVPRGQEQQKMVRNRKLKAAKKDATTPTKAPTPRPTVSGGTPTGPTPDRTVVQPSRTSSGLILANGSTYSYKGVLETSPCADFTSDVVVSKLAGTTDTCATNTCGGCCRIRGYDLVCDTRSVYSSLQCVCNANTFDWSTAPVASPVAAPV